MIKEDYSKFKEIVAGIGEIYDKKVTPVLLSAYWSALKQLTIEEMTEAVNKHLLDSSSGSFFPKPADIIRHTSKAPQKASEAVRDKCEMAWTEIVEKMRRLGSYVTLEMDDKVALAAVRSIGGWKQLCMTNTDKLDFKKRDFFNAYETYERAPVEALPHNLPGRIELENYKKSGGGLKTLAQAGKQVLIEGK